MRIGVEIISCVEGAVAEEFVGGAVELIGPRLGHNIDHRAAVPAILRAKLRLQVELLDGRDRQKRSWGSPDSCLIQSRVIEERIVVVSAVEGVVVRTIAIAVDVELSEAALSTSDAGWINCGSWRQRNQFTEIAAVEGKFGNQLLVHNFAQHIACSVDDWCFFRDRQLFHVFFHPGQVEVCGCVGADVDDDILRHRRQARRFRHDDISSGRKLSQHVSAVFAGRSLAYLAGRAVLGAHLCPRNDVTVRIHYLSPN